MGDAVHPKAFDVSDLRLRFADPAGVVPHVAPAPFGRHLVNTGAISQTDLVNAMGLQARIDARLGDILKADGLISDDVILDTLSKQYNAQRIDLNQDQPRLGMADALPATLCLKHRVVPWLWIGNTLLVATNDPAKFDHFRACVGSLRTTMLPVIADPMHIQTQLNRLYGFELAQKAVARVPSIESCRNWGRKIPNRNGLAIAVFGALLLSLLVAPKLMIGLAVVWAVFTLILTTVLKSGAFLAQIVQSVAHSPEVSTLDQNQFRLPRVSIMVPLLREKEIAGALVKRLSRLTYPKSLLNVVLVLEAKDTITRHTLANTELPPWISVIEVPEAAGPTTKPRALNYALDFCHGSIIGVWDAEDAPEPDQIEKVVMRFNQAPENTACLQGVLDYYNPRTNWISRCFTIEYATWWRLVMPGMARLGLVIPLGGTTLFFKRDILEKLGGWDAHNVTEDADLGVRLARHGYVTELLPTVTHEEANCRAWPWVRQRSRWLKGFLITYCVHMRAPVQLMKDLGFVRFMGLQAIFLASFSQFALAPLLWSFWLVPLGLAHPAKDMFGADLLVAMMFLFIGAELLSLAMGLVAVSGRPHRHLMAWVPTMPVYFILGALASYKALYEMITDPFYWDKTEHGVAHRTDTPSADTS
ncbi:MAG: glycosyltransferase [Ascidiaceihabitans sp.]|uniref:glycosyltransferase n=1 Tax=Ascidiaceihabitans sp. TaxID=1872644 RepID=UPI003298A259